MESMLNQNTTRDMTSGFIYKHIVIFSLPLLAGNIFQLLYNTVDSFVVGNYVGKEALAAIGSTTPLINTLVGFFMGISTGGGVVIAQHFGAGNIVRLKKTVHTMIAATFILGLLFTALGIAFTPFMLRLMSTPDDVFASSAEYLKIYFAGLEGLMLYNMGSGILRAVGDSKRPVYFLVLTSILNVVLDLFFVLVLKTGIAGVAYATIISEAVSAILILAVLFTSKECCKISIKELKIDLKELKKVLKVGLPGGIQMAITSFSNVFVQGYINHFGSSCMAGWASYGKIDQFAILPMQSISMASTTFVGQNFGAHKLDRVRRGVNVSLILSCAVTAILALPLMFFSRPLTALFNKDAEVIYYGSYFLRANSLFYILCCVNQIYAGSLRGLGNATVPMFIMLGSFVVFRQIYLFVITHITTAFFPVAVAYPVGWVLCSAIMTIYYLHFSKKIE